MQSIVKIFVVLTLLHFNGLSQDFFQVKFNVKTEDIPDTSKVHITGNHPALGRWDPAYKKMNLVDDNWEIILNFEKDYPLEFKFTKGTWETEALNPYGSVPTNHLLKVVRDTTLNFTINLWADQINRSEDLALSGKITGKVHYHKNFKGKNILPRDVVVWLPPGYESDTSGRYPVLYMHDGQNAFDPSTSAFGIDWQIDEAADTLIRSGYIEPILIVGIYNTTQRRSEYANNDTGYAYIQFIVEELKPFIDSKYRTLADPNNTAVMGSSLGGLISFIMVWENPKVFSMAASLSPAFNIDRYNYISDVKNYSGEKKNIKFYIDNGGVGLEEELQPGIDEMVLLLDEFGYEGLRDFYWFKDTQAEHNETAWSKRIWRPLIFFFGKESAYDFLKIN